MCKSSFDLYLVYLIHVTMKCSQW